MKLHLPAGTPDDLNREYLPEKIKHTDIVVNENGNNSLPSPCPWWWAATAAS